MQPTQELVDSIYRDRVLHARKQPLEKRFVEGLDLFGEACEWMKVGIRDKHPDADEFRVNNILIEQINRLRRLDDALWTNVPSSAK